MFLKPRQPKRLAGFFICQNYQITTPLTQPFMKIPKNPFHPGEILLEEFLQPMGLTQIQFAKKLGWTQAKLNELIKGKRGITAESALDLSKILRTTAKIWMNFQATWDLCRAMKKRAA